MDKTAETLDMTAFRGGVTLLRTEQGFAPDKELKPAPSDIKQLSPSARPSYIRD